MNTNFDLIITLKEEQELLLDKIAKAREKGDAGTYKNLITALRDISRLIHDEEHMKKLNKRDNILYFEVNKDGTDVYYDNKIYRMVGSFNQSAEYISSICNSDKTVKIYGDCHGFGLGLADSLFALGYKIEDTDLIICDFKKERILERKSNHNR